MAEILPSPAGVASFLLSSLFHGSGEKGHYRLHSSEMENSLLLHGLIHIHEVGCLTSVLEGLQGLWAAREIGGQCFPHMEPWELRQLSWVLGHQTTRLGRQGWHLGPYPLAQTRWARTDCCGNTALSEKGAGGVSPSQCRKVNRKLACFWLCGGSSMSQSGGSETEDSFHFWHLEAEVCPVQAPWWCISVWTLSFLPPDKQHKLQWLVSRSGGWKTVRRQP